jgi:alpha-L-rhamnosidase
MKIASFYQRVFESLLSALLLLLPLSAASHSVCHLTCEQQSHPLGVTATHPRFSWQMVAEERGSHQSAWQILVADSPERLANNEGNMWDSGKVTSENSVLIPYAGTPLLAGKTYYWKVRTWDGHGNVSPYSTMERFDTGLLTDSDWSGARWIAFEKDKKGEVFVYGLHGLSKEDLDKAFPNNKKPGMYKLPCFRKEVDVKKTVRSAKAYISGLGQFDFFVNGAKVGKDFLDPGWTKYDKCALYVTFDITQQIRQGRNALGFMLGNGFFNIPRERYFKLLVSFGAPRLRAKIQIDYTDGTHQTLVTDTSWKAAESAITYNSIYGGEDFDANLWQKGWNEAGFDDRSWSKAIDTHWSTQMLSQMSPPLRVRDTLPPVSLFRAKDGNWVYDFGQNFSGIVRLRLKATHGQVVKIIPAELLKADSTVTQRSSGSPVSFGYTAKGEGDEVWQPQFTYYGFRYAEIEGAVPAGQPNPDGKAVLLALDGLHTCNSSESAGSFSCSNALFNRIYNITDWAVRSNMSSVFTDCPHREKLGWLEQDHLVQSSLQYLYNLPRFYEKIMNDMLSSQTEEGMIPDIAPEYVKFVGGFRDSPEWGSTFILAPWEVYRWYGDKQIIETYYPAMQRYLDYLASKAENHLLKYGLNDWLDISGSTSIGVTATAIYYKDVCTMQQMAALLGKTDDATRYASLAADIKEAFNKEYWHADKQQYDKNSQTVNAMALYMNLVTDSNRDVVLKNLVDDIRSRGNALTTGEIGFGYMLRVLDSNGFSDIINAMNTKYDTPGYGYQIAHGATTLTEAWDANRGLSQNHFCMAHLVDWFMGRLGGIRQSDSSIAFRHLFIDACPTGDVRHAETSYQSPYGLVRTEWRDNSDCFELRVEVPANSSATIRLHTADLSKITESGRPVSEVKELQCSADGQNTAVQVGSGIYRFEVQK